MASKLFAISGVSGAGKTSVMTKVMGKENEVVSTTTRSPRDGEINGVDYHFISQTEFDGMLEAGLFAEHTTYYGRSSYAVTKTEIEDKLSKGNCYIVVDFNGMAQLKKVYGKRMVTIFLYTEKGTAFRRMRLRGDSPQSAEGRLETYETEMMNKGQYDYVIKNNQLENTCRAINALIWAEEENYIRLQ